MTYFALGKKKQWFLFEGSLRSTVIVALETGLGLEGLVEDVL